MLAYLRHCCTLKKQGHTLACFGFIYRERKSSNHICHCFKNSDVNKLSMNFAIINNFKNVQNSCTFFLKQSKKKKKKNTSWKLYKFCLNNLKEFYWRSSKHPKIVFHLWVVLKILQSYMQPIFFCVCEEHVQHI